MVLNINVLILFLIVIIETINCGPAGWINNDGSDTRTKLASLLSSSNEDALASNKVLIKTTNYEPFYKSRYNPHSPQEQFDFYQPNSEDFNKNGKFAIPWLESSEEKKTNDYYESNGSFEEPPRHYNPNHKHGFHKGPWFHHHNHNPDCFPHGNRRRPRPPVPPTSTVAPSIDPRTSSSAGFIRPHPPQMHLVPTTSTSTEGAGIDIRLGTDDDEAERIVFPDD